MELRLTATLDMRPHCTPSLDSSTSPPHPTMNPAKTTTRHPIVRQLTVDPKITTLNNALKGIVKDLRWRGGGEETALSLGNVFQGHMFRVTDGQPNYSVANQLVEGAKGTKAYDTSRSRHKIHASCVIH